jgi:ribosomal protein S18 acetylase RimI-like enzyme
MSSAHPSFHLARQRFEEKFLKGPVIRIDMPAPSGTGYDQSAVEAVVAAALGKDPILVSCRVTANDETSIQQLQAYGFRHVETLVTLERKLDASCGMAQGVEHAVAEDENACVEIARTAFSYDRFHMDPLISDAAADRLKCAWARNSLRGRADACFVIRCDGVAAGFNFCLASDGFAVIDLIAISEEHRGKGLGKQLVAGSLAYYAGSKSVMRVGTQLENRSSIRIYENAGFGEVGRQATLHLLPHGGEIA